MKISEITKLGLWPESKKTTTQKGISELEELGYNLFYIGKNADLYTCPGACLQSGNQSASICPQPSPADTALRHRSACTRRACLGQAWHS